MKKSRSEFKVGVMVLLAISCLVFGILWGKQVSLTAGHYQARVRFLDIAGLEVGAPVLVNGIRKGKVDELQLEEDGVIVYISLKSSVVLNDGAHFKIASPELMGGKVINIFPGTSAKEAQKDYIFVGESGGGMNELMSRSTDLVEDVKHLLAVLEVTINNINKTAGDPRIQEAFLSSINNLDESTERTLELITINEGKLTHMMDNLVHSTETIKSLLENHSEEIDQAVIDFEQFAGKLHESAERLNNLTQKLEDGEGTLGMLIGDEEFAESLRKTVTDLDSLIIQIKEQGLQTNISLFGKKKR